MTEKQPKIKVLAFGTFDYLHEGHESYLQQAKELGNYLMVVVAKDETVRKIKGSPPDNTERKRQKALKALPYVDKVISGNRGDKFKAIKQYKPDIIALGYDQFVFTHQLKGILIQNKLNTEIVRLKPFKPDILKSSIIKKQKCKKEEVISVEA